MRILGALAVAVGCLVVVCGVVLCALLVRSPDSDWIVGLAYSSPLLVGGGMLCAAGAYVLWRA